MKLLVVLCLVGVAFAIPAPRSRYDDVQLLRYNNDNLGYGGYRYAFEQSDGTKHEQQGDLRNEGREDEFLAVKGTYSWVGPDDVTYTVIYVADENGFQPEIQQGPGGAVPAAVQASLVG